MTFKQCSEGSRLEEIMDQAIQARVDAQQTNTDLNTGENQRAVAAASKTEEEFRSHKHGCPDCEIPAA
jgi:hypothetical protein